MRSSKVHSEELKNTLGLAIQIGKLASDQSVLKFFELIDFDVIRDIRDLTEMVNSHGFLKDKISETDFLIANAELENHHVNGVELIPYGSEFYPLSLAFTPNPPSILYIKGDKSILKELPGVAIVGSRDTSPAGEEITRRITNQIVSAGYIVVSGLAIGTDANAHKATLQAKGKTIAVLAHGLEEAKPKQNSRLAQEILDKGGAWISEYPMGRPAQKQSFVQRNRIQVGLSAGSILIEAALNSGTITQAEFANKAKRPVFAVVPHLPNNPLNLNCEGTVDLVKSNMARALKTKRDYDDVIMIINESRKYLLELKWPGKQSTLDLI
ncbi:DNA-processing protein DprA [Escherichia coli]|uniref:DNA-processing protein DprA n=1 Tax=Escherichia coli TaxID=562 RepID=UPI0015D6AC47|nr:DNA-processing protein DprA [Escherichia coli]EEW2530731.1 DNA-processing protein DprA [Escherichia coli]EEZ9757504.1 DNA-processing protein DprA [Escherichia coli O25]EGS3114379.1 DNA-processing protein DprA [Escherichia coli]NZC37816.1 DNA-protecting protein DprA [Escherichia coli]